eukprot:4426379-Prymnesium_polylepis.1
MLGTTAAIGRCYAARAIACAPVATTCATCGAPLSTCACLGARNMPTAYSDASSMGLEPVDVAFCCPRTHATSPARTRSMDS